VGAVALTALLAALCAISALELWGRPFPGFLLYASGAVTSLARSDWEGAHPRLRPRDVIVAVDGTPVHDGAEALARLSRRAPGDEVSLTVSRPGEAARLGLTVRMSHLRPSDIAYVFAMPFAIGVVYLLLGALVFFVKRTRAAALVLALCLVAAAFYLTMFDAHMSYRWSRIWVCYPLLGAISIHLFSVFPEERRRVHRGVVLVPIYGTTGLLCLLRQIYLYRPGPFDLTSLMAGILLALCFLADLILLGFTWSRTSEAAVRSKARTVAFGLVVTITFSVVWAFVSRLGPHLVTADRAMLLSAAFPLLIGYATLRQNLFDLDAVLKKSLTYGVVSVLVVGLYLILVALLSGLISPLAARMSPLGSPAGAAILSTLIVAVAASPLRSYVQRAVTRVFYSETASLSEALVQLARDLESAQAPPELGKRVASQLMRVLDLRGAALLRSDERHGGLVLLGRAGEAPTLDGDEALLLRLSRTRRAVTVADLVADPTFVRALRPELHRELARMGQAVLVPLATRGRLAGLLALSPRRDGHELRADDLELVTALAAPLAIAVDNAILVGERAARERLATLGGVAAVIVHEVKNPLGIIRVSAASLAKRFATGDSGRELAQCIVEEVDRMDATLRQVLSFARPQPPAIVACDLAKLGTRVCGRLARELPPQIQLASELERAPAVWADPLQLERVLINLVQNAAAAIGARPGTITVTARAVRRRLGRRMVELRVADDGPGMDEATRARLFEPFFTTRPGGTGLGLAIVKQILDEHQGEISVESEPERGSAFCVTLPEAGAQGNAAAT
jgi:signal transduction histidine kinase